MLTASALEEGRSDLSRGDGSDVICAAALAGASPRTLARAVVACLRLAPLAGVTLDAVDALDAWSTGDCGAEDVESAMVALRAARTDAVRRGEPLALLSAIESAAVVSCSGPSWGVEFHAVDAVAYVIDAMPSREEARRTTAEVVKVALCGAGVEQ